MPRHAHHDPAPPACYCCDGVYAPAPCCDPAPVPAPCYYPSPVPAPAPATPWSSASDHLIHAIVARLLLGSSEPAPAPAPQPQQQPPPPPPAAHHAANPYPHPHHYHFQYQQQEAKHQEYVHPPPPPPQQQQHQPQPSASDHSHLMLHSLLRRVAALESALPRCFPPSPPARRTPHRNLRPHRVARQDLVHDDDVEEELESSPPSPPPYRRPPPPWRPTLPESSSSAKELAARTIQAHFRRFLARRSRTLRQLKELAVLRSQSAALRGSLSGRRGGADPAAVSKAATGLLLRLETIQGGDPMIREGKRAVSRELTRILEFADKVLAKEHEQLATGDALGNGDYHEGCRADSLSSRPAVSKKKVSFSSNGRIHELNGETDNVKEVDEASESLSSSESDEVKGMPGKKSANSKPAVQHQCPCTWSREGLPQIEDNLLFSS